MPISQQTLAFLGENRLRDSREWFAENRQQYKTLVEEPLLALSAQVGPTAAQIDPLITTEPRRTLSRIWRDQRFSKDHAVFREVMWLVFRRGKGMEYPAFFFEFSPTAYRYGVGYYAAPPAVMETIRRWVLGGDKRFLRAQKAIESLPGFVLEGDAYKRPRYPDAPPDLQPWLNRKGIVVLHNGTKAETLFSDTLGDTLCDAFLKLAPVYQLFLEAHLS